MEIAVGTGTLANEMVAAQLSTIKGKGLILSNGEFGDRLIQQANRWQLDFETFQKSWNMPITADEVKKGWQRIRKLTGCGRCIVRLPRALFFL